MTEATREQATVTLIGRIRDGDDSAREELFRRCLPLLRRFARGRLPAQRRDMAETDDLVQVTLLRALNNVERFDAREVVLDKLARGELAALHGRLQRGDILFAEIAFASDARTGGEQQRGQPAEKQDSFQGTPPIP